jgi:hypothetical protein
MFLIEKNVYMAYTYICSLSQYTTITISGKVYVKLCQNNLQAAENSKILVLVVINRCETFDIKHAMYYTLLCSILFLLVMIYVMNLFLHA